MNRLGKNTITAAVAGAMLLGGAGAALAGTTEASYSTTVGRFNGNGYTAYQTKAGSGTAAKLWVESIGADYGVDAWLNSPSGGPIGWSRMGDRTYADLYNNVPAGKPARVQFSNDALTPVAVQVSGVWRSM